MNRKPHRETETSPAPKQQQLVGISRNNNVTISVKPFPLCTRSLMALSSLFSKSRKNVRDCTYTYEYKKIYCREKKNVPLLCRDTRNEIYPNEIWTSKKRQSLVLQRFRAVTFIADINSIRSNFFEDFDTKKRLLTILP